MSNNNFVVGIVDKIGQPSEDGPTFHLDKGIEGPNTRRHDFGAGGPTVGEGRPPSWKEVHFHGLTERAFIDMNDPRSEGWEELIDAHRALRLPVTFEREPRTQLITRTLLPEVGRVIAIRRGFRDYRIDIDTCPSPLRLNPSHWGFQSTLEQLRIWRRTGQKVVATLDPNDDTIIDLRAFTGVQLNRRRFSILDDEDAVIATVSAMSVDERTDFYRTLIQNRCEVPTTGACVPYRYVYGNCFVFAHYIYKELLKVGVTAGKAWLYDDVDGLWFDTCNHPKCWQGYRYHVATFVRPSTTTHDRREFIVFDPVVLGSKGPVTLAQWRASLHAHRADLVITDGGVFDQKAPGEAEEEFPNETEDNLQKMRKLLNRMQQTKEGPPPYSRCRT
jgi:hypothetical protein